MDFLSYDTRQYEFEVHALTETPTRASNSSVTLSGVERTVVLVSRGDSLSSIPDLPGWRGGLAWLFPGDIPKHLANERLEALRRFAILARHFDDPGNEAISRFLDAGYTSEQSRLVSALARGGKVSHPGKWSNQSSWMFLLLVCIGIYCTILAILGEVTISLIATGLIYATLVSLFIPKERSVRGTAGF